MKPQALIKDDFKNLLDYQQWLGNSMNNLSYLNQYATERFAQKHIERSIASDRNWFGENVTYQELADGVTEYNRPDLLDELYNKVSHQLNPVVSQRLKARKMKFNPLGFGMFCFDRAAMTMYRNEEFYSPSKRIKVDKQEVKKASGGFALKKDNSKIIKRWEQKPDGTPKIRTNTKDLFAYFPEVPRDRHAVEFFISTDAAASVKAEEILYGGVSAVIMAELLIKAGIKVKINVVIGSATSRERDKWVGCIIPVKQYDETLDRNIIALLSSDPRFMRFDAFKGVVAAYDSFKMSTPEGMGYAMNAAQLKTLLEDSGYTKKSQAAHRYYFGGTFTEQAAIRDINNTIEDIASNLKK